MGVGEQSNPQMFQAMMGQIKEESVGYLFNVEVQVEAQPEEVVAELAEMGITDGTAIQATQAVMAAAQSQSPIQMQAPAEVNPEIAVKGIARLNLRYPTPDGTDRFFLLHRRRGWNEAQGAWIGWERKRGKLHELNHLLRGSTDTTFVVAAAGAVRPLPADVRYIVTLDSDTRLPRDAIVRLVGKMAHPLNRPRFEAAEGRVVEGYGVLQPRVTPSPLSATTSPVLSIR